MNQLDFPLQPLKFRVWDSKQKKMIYQSGPECYEVTLHGNIHYYRRQLDGKVDGDMFARTGEGFIVSQWTGLKDVKGNDIYGGDIVKARDKNARITFLEGCYCLAWLNPFDISRPALFQTNETVVLLGNIWETPELLNMDKPRENDEVSGGL